MFVDALSIKFYKRQADIYTDNRSLKAPHWSLIGNKMPYGVSLIAQLFRTIYEVDDIHHRTHIQVFEKTDKPTDKVNF